MQSHRHERLAAQLQIELSELISQELRDPRLGFATVAEVRVSPDLRHARVFVSVMGTAEEEAQSLKTIQGAAQFLRREAARSLGLRQAPELHIELDRTEQRAERVEELLEQIKKSEDR